MLDIAERMVFFSALVSAPSFALVGIFRGGTEGHRRGQHTLTRPHVLLARASMLWRRVGVGS